MYDSDETICLPIIIQHGKRVERQGILLGLSHQIFFLFLGPPIFWPSVHSGKMADPRECSSVVVCNS